MNRRLFWAITLLSCMTPVLGVASPSDTITFQDAAGNQQIYVFSTAIEIGDTGHLLLNYWDGFNWNWSDQGLPPLTGYVSTPAAVAYVDSAGNQQIYAFATTGGDRFVVNYWDGFNWYWSDQGPPPVGTHVRDPKAAITYLDGTGSQQIYAFPCFGRLFANYWDGFNWYWSDEGLAPGPTGVSPSHAITYMDGAGNQQIYVFATGDSNGHLVVRYSDGLNWYWSDQGLPTGATSVSRPAAITYLDGAGNQQIYVFATGNNGHLFIRYWDGFNWNWTDEGLPAGATSVTNPTAITYLDAAGNQRIYAFVQGDNGHLLVHYWDGFNWYWADEGPAPGATQLNNPSAITYVDGAGNQQIYAFVRVRVGSARHLAVHYWDGFNWYWADLGQL